MWWEALATGGVGGGELTVVLTDKDSSYRVVADAVRIQRIEGDCGLDDDFSVLAGTPTLDAGDPDDYYLSEPGGGGGRVNLGHTGNTPQALASAAQRVQMVSPNGLEKLEVGELATVRWRSAGLTLRSPVALINAGSTTPAVEHWLANAYQTVSYTGSFSSAVDVSGVSDPAPEAVYQQYSQAYSDMGNRISWELPVEDGSYALRLHFVEPDYGSADQRKFDIFQGT